MKAAGPNIDVGDVSLFHTAVGQNLRWGLFRKMGVSRTIHGVIWALLGGAACAFTCLGCTDVTPYL